MKITCLCRDVLFCDMKLTTVIQHPHRAIFLSKVNMMTHSHYPRAHNSGYLENAKPLLGMTFAKTSGPVQSYLTPHMMTSHRTGILKSCK